MGKGIGGKVSACEEPSRIPIALRSAIAKAKDNARKQNSAHHTKQAHKTGTQNRDRLFIVQVIYCSKYHLLKNCS